MSVEGQRRCVDTEIADYYEICRLRRENSKLRRVAGNRLLLNVFLFIVLSVCGFTMDYQPVPFIAITIGMLAVVVYLVFLDGIEEEMD